MSEDLIKWQADEMVSSRMKVASYAYINIDDSYFGGRDERRNIIRHPKWFPHGIKTLAGYFHSKGSNILFDTIQISQVC